MATCTCKKREREKSTANNGNQVTEVWKSNLRTELDNISNLGRSMQHVFFDTEFPGFLLQTARDVSEEDSYRAVRFNVDRLKVIQLGITMSDGIRSFSWQFNLKEFDPKVDSHSEASVAFLKECGIDLEKNRVDGVDALQLSTFLADTFIGGCGGTKWVTFHGIYDVAYLLKLICQNPLPSTLSEFLQAVSSLFGAVYDVKYMARECSGAFAEVGLVRLAKMLGVKWAGKSHQAGHDSLLTAMAFWELKKKYADFDEDRYAGLMFGVERHGLAQLNNVIRPYHPMDARSEWEKAEEDEAEILMSYRGVVPAQQMIGNFMSGYCDLDPPPCFSEWEKAEEDEEEILMSYRGVVPVQQMIGNFMSGYCDLDPPPCFSEWEKAEEDEEEILMSYCGIVPVQQMIGNFMSGYCDLDPPPCFYYGYQPSHDDFGPATLIQVPVPGSFYG